MKINKTNKSTKQNIEKDHPLTEKSKGPILGTVRLTHTRSIKQVLRYQSADVSYGVEVVVQDNPKEIKKGIARIERIVEDALGEKLPETERLLQALAAQNN